MVITADTSITTPDQLGVKAFFLIHPESESKDGNISEIEISSAVQIWASLRSNNPGPLQTYRNLVVVPRAVWRWVYNQALIEDADVEHHLIPDKNVDVLVLTHTRCKELLDAYSGLIDQRLEQVGWEISVIQGQREQVDGIRESLASLLS